MKHKSLSRLIIASVVSSTLITTLAPVGASAAWVKNAYGSWSYTEGNSYATGWRKMKDTWYFFDSTGQMKTGWIYNNGEWYYSDLSGAMQTGVVQIEGKTYLLSPSGAMQKGKCIINAKFYDFDDNGEFIGTDYPAVTRGFDYLGNSTIIYVPSQTVTENGSMSSDIPSDGSKQVKQYKVKFIDSEAEDDDDELLKTRTIDENTKITLYKPAKSGYTFVEWNTDDDGDGSSYEYDEMIKITKDISLYAQWEVQKEESPDKDVIKVESIKVSSSSGSTTIATAGGSLLMAKKVYPSDADNQKVKWTVSNGTGEASISATGKLTAVSDGTVTVKATATDGSNVVGELVVTISGQ